MALWSLFAASSVSEGLILEYIPRIVHMIIEGKGVIKNNSQVLKHVRMLNGLSI